MMKKTILIFIFLLSLLLNHHTLLAQQKLKPSTFGGFDIFALIVVLVGISIALILIIVQHRLQITRMRKIITQQLAHKSELHKRLTLQEEEIYNLSQTMGQVKDDLRFKDELLYLNDAQLRAADLVSSENSSDVGYREPETVMNNIVARKTRDTLESIMYARQIQQAMLPKLEVFKSVIPESFVLFRPRDIVSGDFYWFNAKSHRSVIGAVDCTGHGVPGAFLSMIGNELLNKIVIFKGITEPHKILNQLQMEMRNTLKQKENGNEDGMDIGICTLHLVPPELQELFGRPRLEFSGAKNTLIYIQKDKMHIIKGDKVPIGGYLFQDDYNFTNHIIPLEEDTTFYMFSDGYADQFGGKERKKFMVGRFRDLLLEIYKLPLEQQKRRLEKELLDWMAGMHQIDDILVMGFRITV